ALPEARRRAKLLRRRERTKLGEQPPDEVDLRLVEGDIEPHAAGRSSMAHGCVCYVAAWRAGEVRVVEGDSSRACSELVVQCLRGIAARAATFVAVDAHVAERDVLLGETTLAGTRNAHHQHDLAAAGVVRLRG